MTKSQKRLLIFVNVYSFLFMVIGPKFSLYDVARDAKQGQYVHDKIDRFIWGGYQNGVWQFCFEGVLRGQVSELFLKFRQTS